MAVNVLVDAGFVVALLSRRDTHHRWALTQAKRYPPPWKSCESAVSESFHLLGSRGMPALNALLRRGALTVAFDFSDHLQALTRFLEKYADVPASLADACLIRMTEILHEPMVLTTDEDFRVYRRHGRTTVPSVTP